MSTLPTALFLDTMIYLHYLHVEQVDWLLILNKKEIVIVVPRIIIRELDKHKDSHHSRDVRERARSMLQRIEGLVDSSNSRNGVRIETYTKLPRLDLSEFELDPSRADDMLIASILQYRFDNPNCDVLLVTQDTTPKLIARSLGIEVTSLQNELKLQAAIDPVEKENRDLRRQLDRIKAASPKLTLQFMNAPEKQAGHMLCVRMTQPSENPELLFEKMNAEQARKYPPLSKSKELSSEATIEKAFRAMVGVHESEFTRYNREREKYFEEYNKYLRDSLERFIADSLSFDIEIQVINSGTLPAEDVDVSLRLPSIFKLIDKDLVPNPPKAPHVPTMPRNNLEMANISLSGFGTNQKLSDSLIKGLPQATVNQNVSSLRIDKTENYDVHWHIKRVKHQLPIALDPLRVTFESLDDVRGFCIEYRLVAANILDPIEGKLNVTIKTALEPDV